MLAFVQNDTQQNRTTAESHKASVQARRIVPKRPSNGIPIAIFKVQGSPGCTAGYVTLALPWSPVDRQVLMDIGLAVIPETAPVGRRVEYAATRGQLMAKGCTSA
jgi:hypothetical protein